MHLKGNIWILKATSFLIFARITFSGNGKFMWRAEVKIALQIEWGYNAQTNCWVDQCELLWNRLDTAQTRRGRRRLWGSTQSLHWADDLKPESALPLPPALSCGATTCAGPWILSCWWAGCAGWGVDFYPSCFPARTTLCPPVGLHPWA